MGLRLISEADKLQARAEAERYALMMQSTIDQQVDAYNDTLIAWCVACSLCDPNDASREYLQLQQDNVRLAFTTEAIVYLWHELEMLHESESCARNGASDGDLIGLAALLVEEDPFIGMSAEDERRCRGHLASVLDTLRSCHGEH